MRSKVCIFNEFGESSYYITSDISRALNIYHVKMRDRKAWKKKIDSANC